MSVDYLRPADAADHRRLAQPQRLASTGVELHVDWYPQPRADAPALVLIHGGGGHAGLLAGLALACHRAGYAVAVPDQRGQGRSGGARGDFTVDEAVRNIVDATAWVRARTTGPTFLAGGSIGGGLAYAAAARLARDGHPPAAIACLNFYDFGDPRTALQFSRMPGLARVPGAAALVRAGVRALARAWPSLRVPYRLLADFSAMLDDRDAGAYALWRTDPLALRTVTLRHVASLFDTSAAIAPEDNRDVPVLVLNPMRDRMVRPGLTRETFERLGGERRYVEIDHGHFSLQPAFAREVVAIVDEWFAAHGRGPAPETRAA